MEDSRGIDHSSQACSWTVELAGRPDARPSAAVAMPDPPNRYPRRSDALRSNSFTPSDQRPTQESERASRAGISPNGQRSEEAALRSRSERRAGPSESRGEPRRPPNRRPAAGRLAAPPSRAGQGSERVADQTSRTVCPFFSETFEHDEIVFFRATECLLGSRCELRKLQCNLL